MSGAERGSLLEWRWTPFFALLTLALVVSLVTALLVPSTPAQFFATPEMTRALGKRTGIPTQSGMGSTLSLEGADGTNDEPATVGGGATNRRGSLQRLAERNRSSLSPRPAPAPRQFAEPIRREIPPPPEPELSNERAQQEEAPAQDQAADEAEEDEPEAPPPTGSGGAGPESEGEVDEEGPPAPAERPKLVNPGVLRAIPGLQR